MVCVAFSTPRPRNRPARGRQSEGGLGDATFAVPRDVTRDLAAAGRVADVHGFFQVEMRRERREVVGVVIHVVSVAGLAGASVTSPVVGDDAIAVI